jgi:hypothetical protein
MKAFPTYEAAFAWAQEYANANGQTMGLERNDGPLTRHEPFRVCMLPRPENRQGFELRCEVVDPMIYKTCSSCRKSFTLPQWRALPLPSGCAGGAFPDGIKVDEFQREQYRNCECGSTLVVVLEVYKVTP